MRVALVCPYAWDRHGGVQTHVRALRSSLSERGHEVETFAPISVGAHHRQAEVVTLGRAVSIPANGSVAPLSFGPGGAIGVRRALRAFRPEVIHLHEPLIPSLSLTALLNANAPSVGTFHASAEGSLGYRMSRPMLERAVRRLTIRTAVSDEARALIARYFPGEYALTPNGVDVSRFSGAVPTDLGASRTVLFVGRIERRKGLEVLIQSMTRLHDLEATLVVVGGGPQTGPCRRLADRLGVSARFLGRVHDDELPRVYRAADVYCAPGLGGESFGIVLIEAMAAGAPVVCSDLPAFRFVGRGAARLVPPGSPGDLADALRAVLTDDDEARRMSKAGARIASMFDWRRLTANVEATYERATEV